MYITKSHNYDRAHYDNRAPWNDRAHYDDTRKNVRTFKTENTSGYPEATHFF